MQIKDEIIYVGVNDYNLDLFEGQYIVPNGMAYNSYAVIDEKIAIMDSVGSDFVDEWLGNIKTVLGDRIPDYLVIQHMEPDHSANIIEFMNAFPSSVIVSSDKAFTMMKNFFGVEFENRRIVITEGDTLNLGKHILNFYVAPMVHWPEVIVTYDSTDKVLFSADAFGKFGAVDVDEDWACEARRYYFGIVGKYGMQVQKVLAKVNTLDIETICPLHGPVLNENLGYYLNLYDIWSSYNVESDGIFIAYTSVYGNTEKAVKILAEKLKEKGCSEVEVNDLARSDMAECVENAFRYGKIILATTTYNSDIFPFMKDFINRLTERGFKNKKIGMIENGSWAPVAAKVMTKLLDGSKNISYTNNNVKIISAVNDENIAQIEALAEEICN